MTNPDRAPDADWPAAIEVAAACAGMCLFALFAHSRSALFMVSVGGLGLAAAALGRAVIRSRSPLGVFGLSPTSGKVAVYAPIGLALGLAFGVWYRLHCGWPPLPGTLRGFALVAALIGGAEEVLYRGYVQGRVRRLGVIGAVVCAAVLHTAYKGALFAFPPIGVTIDIEFIATWTLLGGLVFGFLRELSGSVIPPLAAHVCFDLIVYSEQVKAPWWVWA